MLQWIVVAVLVYVIYYLINKYEKKINYLTEKIELRAPLITLDTHNITSFFLGEALT